MLNAPRPRANARDAGTGRTTPAAAPAQSGSRFATGAAYQAILDASTDPGRVVQLPAVEAPAPLQPATLAVCLSLFGYGAPVWLDARLRAQPNAVERLRSGCGSRLAETPREAAFAVITDGLALPPLGEFRQGTRAAPERSTTLVVQVDVLRAGAGRRLHGIVPEAPTRLHVRGLPPRFWRELDANRARYPYGVDLLLTCGSQLVALPRTVAAGPLCRSDPTRV